MSSPPRKRPREELSPPIGGGNPRLAILETRVVGVKLGRCLSRQPLHGLHRRLRMSLASRGLGKWLGPDSIHNLFISQEFLPNRYRYGQNDLCWQENLPRILHLYIEDSDLNFAWKLLVTKEPYPSLRNLEIEVKVVDEEAFRGGAQDASAAYTGLRRLSFVNYRDMDEEEEEDDDPDCEEMLSRLLSGLPRPELLRNLHVEPYADIRRLKAFLRRLPHLRHISGVYLQNLDYPSWAGRGLVSAEGSPWLPFPAEAERSLRRLHVTLFPWEKFGIEPSWPPQIQRLMLSLSSQTHSCHLSDPFIDLQPLCRPDLSFALTCLSIDCDLCELGEGAFRLCGDEGETRALGDFIDGFARLRQLKVRVTRADECDDSVPLRLSLRRAPLELLILHSIRAVSFRLCLAAVTEQSLREIRWYHHEKGNSSLRSLHKASSPVDLLDEVAETEEGKKMERSISRNKSMMGCYFGEEMMLSRLYL